MTMIAFETIEQAQLAINLYTKDVMFARWYGARNRCMKYGLDIPKCKVDNTDGRYDEFFR